MNLITDLAVPRNSGDGESPIALTKTWVEAFNWEARSDVRRLVDA